MFVLCISLRIPDPYLFLGYPDSLSACLGIDSLIISSQRPWLSLMAIIWKRNSTSHSLKEDLWRSLSVKANNGGVCTIHNLATRGNGDDIIKGCSLWWLFIWSCKLINEKEREKVGGEREREVRGGWLNDNEPDSKGHPVQCCCCCHQRIL